MKRKSFMNSRLFKSGIALLCAASLCITCFPSYVSAYDDNDFESGAANGEENTMPLPGGGTHVEPHDSSTFTILEVLPDVKCGLMGFWFGGCEPLYVRPEAFSHRAESDQPTMEELRYYAMDAFVNDTTGGDSSTYHDPWYHNQFTLTANNSGDQTAFLGEYGLCNGYFEKVGKGLGVYGYSEQNLKVTEGKVKTVPGTGEYKITHTYGGYRCISDIKSWERGNYLDEPLFEVTFKADASAKSGVGYYAPETVKKVKKGQGEYKLVKDVYEYVGLNKDGEYSVTFEAQYNKNFDKYGKRVYAVDKVIETGNGTYLASKNDSKENVQKRSSTATVQEGFDYTDGITDVSMTSKFQGINGNTKGISFDYVWVEDDSSELPVSTTAEVGKKLNKMKVGDRVYLKNYYKAKYLNNELFWTMIFQGDDGKYGIPGTSGEQPLYLDKDASGRYENMRQGSKYQLAPDASGEGTNKDFVDAWKAGKTIEVIPCSTDSIQWEDLEKADLIVFDGASDGAYQQQPKVYNCCFDTTGQNWPGSVSSIPDISWEQALEIYKRVVVDGDCAICMAGIFVNHYDDSNLKKLFYMLFGVMDEDAPDDPSKGDKTLGSGREFFLDFLEELVESHGDPNSPNLETLASGNYLQYSYIDNNGAAGKNGGTLLDYQRDNMKRDLSWSSSSPIDSWVNGNNIFVERFLQYNSSSDLQVPIYYYYTQDAHHMKENPTWRDPNPNEKYWNNQMTYNSTHSLFKYLREANFANATWIGKILRYNNPPYMSMKILNYDSCNSDGSNKVIPIQRYEYEKKMVAAGKTIPINYRIVSSTEILSIKITLPDGTVVSQTPVEASSSSGYTYNMTYDVPYTLLTTNSNKFTVTARNATKEISDSVIISIADMFELN